MPLDRPRRIFIRKRRFQARAAARSVGVLALGLSAAAGATVLVNALPAGEPVRHTELPAVTDRPVLRVHDPVMRVAATLPRGWDDRANGSSQDGGRHGARSGP